MEMPRLQDLLTDNDMTQKELADIIGVTRKQVNSWINGHAEMGIDKLIKICRHFNVSADYILELEMGLAWPREERTKKHTDNYTKYTFLYKSKKKELHHTCSISVTLFYYIPAATDVTLAGVLSVTRLDLAPFFIVTQIFLNNITNNK